MSADFGTNIIIKGDSKEISKILRLLRNYKEGNCDYYFSSITFGGSSIKHSSLLKLSDEAIDQLVTDIQGTIEIDADGPYGRFGGVDDITLFEEISAEVPTCYFSGVIEGYCGEGRQVVKGELSECVLHLWYKYADDDGDDYDCDEEMIQWDEETIYNPIKKKYQ